VLEVVVVEAVVGVVVSGTGSVTAGVSAAVVVEVTGSAAVVAGTSEAVVTVSEVVVTALVNSSSSENSHHMKMAMAMSSKAKTHRSRMSRQNGDQPEAAWRPFTLLLQVWTRRDRRVGIGTEGHGTFVWASSG